jgi:hypothetical protein
MVYNIRQGKKPCESKRGKGTKMESKEMLKRFIEGLTAEEAEVLLKAAKMALPQVEDRERAKKREETLRYVKGMAFELGRKMPEIVTEFVVDCYGAIVRVKREENSFALVEVTWKE